MQDETHTNHEEASSDNAVAESTDSKSKNTAKHVFYEVGNDLLAKPEALSKVLQANGYPAAVIFCNSPSEADMVDVMLKKRSISCTKLIGHVPYQKVAIAIQKVANKEINCLIITDVAAREMEIDDLEMVINYSIHEDPEIYLHRITGIEKAEKVKFVVSLVSPLDFSNFHYLRKIVEHTIDKAELPSDAEVAKAQMQEFFERAVQEDCQGDESLDEWLEKVMNHDEKEKVIRFLLHNTLNVIPELKKKSSSGRNRRDRNDRDRGDNRRDRGDRDSRDNNRGRNRRDRDNNRGNDRRRDRNDRNDRNDRRNQKNLAPAKKDIRFYIGHGTDAEFTEKEFSAILADSSDFTEGDIKRFSVRGHYAFVDFAEEIAEQVHDCLKDSARENGDDLCLTRATVINLPREEIKEEQNDDDDASGHSNDSDDQHDEEE